MEATAHRSQVLADALARLGVDHLALAIHDASFPSRPDEDIGRGTPYGEGAGDFLRFARELGFNVIQLGPQGRTSAVNASPYDGTLFARSELSLSLSALARVDGLLPEEALRALVAGRPAGAHVHPAYAREAVRAALDEAFARRGSADLEREVQRCSEGWAPWLEADSLFLALSALHGTEDWRRWPPLDRRLLWPAPEEFAAATARRAELRASHVSVFAKNAFVQTLWCRQHAALRERLAQLGLLLFGDLQVGVSFQEQWSFASVFLPGFRLGAPPSRTNPDGQPWGYPVLDPAQYRAADGGPGPALDFVLARVRRVLQEFDGVRVDHPHGWVCPWVYLADVADSFAAVQGGARLFSSPDRPELTKYSIVDEAQLDRSLPRYADRWVRSLSDAQVDQYGVLLQVILDEAQRQGRDRKRVLCEVLSTWPYPLRRVMERYGLGRFLVTQKADPNQPDDVYRSEHARPEDWMMLGTHDTASIWSVVAGWSGQMMADRARHLAERLEPEPSVRAAYAASLSTPEAMVEALFAELFSAQARGVSVFFADLLGMTDRYNAPGTVGPENWGLRVPAEFKALYVQRVREGRALSVPSALRRALRAKRIHAPELQAALRALM